MKGQFPRRFGKYVLLKPLAKGGMGEIYLAAGGEIGGFEKLCVIKKVIAEKSDVTKANRFLDEAKVVLRLSHSALVSTFDAGEADGAFYIAMELVEGKDLREVWNRCVRVRQRIPLDAAVHVVREVARALAYVHGYGELKLVHRDVAPPNILLAYVGDVKLTDFGLARSILKQEHTAPGVVFGRAAYLSPEQARGEVADQRTDVYTLGIVLWELLTGQQFLQLSGMDPATALTMVRHPKVVPPSRRAPWIPSALDAVVMRALTFDRSARYETAEEFRQALSTVMAETGQQPDAGRVAEFMRAIYSETIAEERAEREHFLKEVIPKFRAGIPVDGKPERATDAAAVAPPPDSTREEAVPVAFTSSPSASRRSARVVPLPGLPPPASSADGVPDEGANDSAPLDADIDLSAMLLAEKRLAAERAVPLAIQICRALAPMHARGQCHGDLRPERILVPHGAPGDAISNLHLVPAPAAPARIPPAGVPYWPPERLDGAQPDARADVYAVGAILYEMVAGVPPASTSPERKRPSEPVQSPRFFRPEISTDLERVILAALDPAAAKRPQSASAFADALGKVASTRVSRLDEAAPVTVVIDRGSLGRNLSKRKAALAAIDELAAAKTVDDVAAPLVSPILPPAEPAKPSTPRPASPIPDSSPAFGGGVLARYGMNPESQARSRRVRGVLLVCGLALAGLVAAQMWFRQGTAAGTEPALENSRAQGR